MIKNSTHHMSKIAAVTVVAASAAISRWRTNHYISDIHASAASDPV